MIIPPNFLVKTIPLYSEGDVSTPHVVINYLTRSLFFILLKFPPNWKLIKVKEIKDRIFIKNLDHKMTMGLMEAKRIVDELTIEYDMNSQVDKAVVCNTTIAGLSPASTSKRVGEDGYLESFISSRPRFKSETRYTKF